LAAILLTVGSVQKRTPQCVRVVEPQPPIIILALQFLPPFLNFGPVVNQMLEIGAG
jgi:hypothetical protein